MPRTLAKVVAEMLKTGNIVIEKVKATPFSTDIDPASHPALFPPSRYATTQMKQTMLVMKSKQLQEERCKVVSAVKRKSLQDTGKTHLRYVCNQQDPI